MVQDRGGEAIARIADENSAGTEGSGALETYEEGGEVWGDFSESDRLLKSLGFPREGEGRRLCALGPRAVGPVLYFVGGPSMEQKKLRDFGEFTQCEREEGTCRDR